MVKKSLLVLCFGTAIAGLLWAKTAFESRLSFDGAREPTVSLESAKFHSRSLKNFSLGFDVLIADILWVGLLQAAEHTRLEKKGVSWEYATLKGILELDPKFLTAYPFGSSFVMVFRQDFEGAEDLLRQWTLAVPNDWKSHYQLGFFLFHDRGDYPAAAQSMLRALELPGAPQFLSALGVRLLSHSGSYFSSLQTALSLYAKVTHEEPRERLRQRIRSLNYQLQKSAFTAHHKSAKDAPERNLAFAVRSLPAPEEVRPLLNEQFEFAWDPKAQRAVGLLASQFPYLESTEVFGKELPR